MEHLFGNAWRDASGVNRRDHQLGGDGGERLLADQHRGRAGHAAPVVEDPRDVADAVGAADTGTDVRLEAQALGG